MGELPQCLLNLIDKKGSVNSILFSQDVNEPHQKVVGAIKSLESLGNVVTVVQKTEKNWACTEEGSSLVKDGSHEARLFNFLPPEGKTVADIKTNFPNAGFAMGAALKNKWVQKSGDKLTRAVPQIIDQVKMDLTAVVNGKGGDIPAKLRADYKKRKLIKEFDVTLFEVSKGPEFTTSISKQEAELTKEMIESGNWKEKAFKPFNFRSKGKLEHRAGHLHPLMQLRAEFRQIFLEMGFTEMPTNSYVESAFWNFDALFQPQQHPARDQHDTFYVSDPPTALHLPEDYLQRVCKTHSEGGYGSQGYQYKWSREEAEKNLLRTHTTAVSARMLYKLAQNEFKPAKYFSIDRVFRNETLDATHLAEFCQIEGVVADYNLGIKHLMGLFTAFYEKIGITKLRFKPAYNPYTEPSMEIFSYHEGLQKWVEVGNSGIFRPEMLRPMGLPENVSVIAWGLSLERPTMIKCGINNIRELVGPRVKMELILDNAICTVDKFKKMHEQDSCYTSALESLRIRQENIINKLDQLQQKFQSVLKVINNTSVGVCKSNLTKLTTKLKKLQIHDVVVYAHPSRMPYSLKPMVSILKSAGLSVFTRVHKHSSVQELSTDHLNFFDNLKNIVSESRTKCDVCLTLVWRDDNFSRNLQPAMSITPMSPMIHGEHNICRYLTRISHVQNNHKCSTSLYEMQDDDIIVKIDECLDDAYSSLVCGSAKEKSLFTEKLKTRLQKTKFLCGNYLTIADLVTLSILQQLKLKDARLKWVQLCSQDQLGALLL